MCGHTTSTDIGMHGAHQDTLGGGWDAFLAKFSDNGALSWFTYYGGALVDEATDTVIDASENLCITGRTASFSCISTNDAFQTGNAGIQDIFIAIFNKSGKLNWATYYGGDLSDIGRSICCDKLGAMYVAAFSLSPGLATSGAYQSIINNDGSFDALIIKWSNPLKNDAGIKAMDGLGARGCSNQKVALTAQLKNFGTSVLKAVTIRCIINGVQQNDYLWTGSLMSGSIAKVNLQNLYFPEGFYTISIYTMMPNGNEDSVQINDTLTVKYRSTPAPPSGWYIVKTGAAYYFQVLDSSLGPYYYYWELGDEFYYNGYSFLHSFPKKKTYTAKLVTTNSFGCVNELDTVLDESGLKDVTIFPNPFRDKAIIHFKTSEMEGVKIDITNTNGQYLYNVLDRSLSPGIHEITLDTEAKLSAGTYFLIITIGKERKIIKVVIQ